MIPTSNHNIHRQQMRYVRVVYLLIPTSNHNWRIRIYNYHVLYIFWFLHQTTTSNYNAAAVCWLYIFWFLHQTTTIKMNMLCCSLLYIFWFLHQTTTNNILCPCHLGCISFDSYIKPQLDEHFPANEHVVYLLIPTSNHNEQHRHDEGRYVVYLLIPTSNHNYLYGPAGTGKVVYLLIPTSNHN